MKKNWSAALMLFAAALLVALGITLDQPTQVLTKAIRVCMECIGIG